MRSAASGVFRLGLTGGIGSGKSTVAHWLGARGALLLDADAASRDSTAAGGRAMPDIRREFGDAFVAPDGSLDRQRMREKVFSDPQAKARLESIIHPQVHAMLEEKLARLDHGVAVFDIPLLVESGRWRERLHAVLVVDCDRETQIQRVMARNGWTREAVERVIDAQAARPSRLDAADAVLFNGLGHTLEQLEADVTEMARSFGL